LLKVLAVEQPLSIQLHPSDKQAQEGFRRERALGLSSSDPQANYRDDWPKPEILCPLTEFEALCGFRPVGELISLFEGLGGSCFLNAAETLHTLPRADARRSLVTAWLCAESTAKDELLQAGLDACSRAVKGNTACSNEAALALELADRCPGDPGALVALLLRHFRLQAGQGLFVPAGVMHAYLRGFAVEVMASSDNVLRGGLTPKHVDVQELLSLLDFEADPPSVLSAQEHGPLEKCFTAPVRHFQVSRVDVVKNTSWCASLRRGPEMLLCADGSVCLASPSGSGLTLMRSECAWISADEDVYCLSGEGQAFRVCVGRGDVPPHDPGPGLVAGPARASDLRVDSIR
jgi:mannose-6-phosphate isomerase